MNLEKFRWTRFPQDYKIENNKISITTKPFTDLWQRTYYNFQNDNAPVFQMETDKKFFSFCVKVDFSATCHRFDQAGIVMYLDSENWLKASAEYENENLQHLGSVVTRNGYSDWATTNLSPDIKSMWYRLSRREDDFLIENSFDGVNYNQMRICHMDNATDIIKFGVYACSPEDSSFTAIFTDFKLLECKWQAHK